MGRIVGWVAAAALCFIAGTAQAEEGVAVDFDGYFKVDLAYDSAVSSHGNFIMYVKPQASGTSTHTLNLTARQTRLGMNVTRDRAKGRIELDFYGGGAENKNLIVLRKAYVDVEAGPFVLRAGQASDIISPLVPSTLNYTVAWGVGNIGYRRPIVQVSVNRAGTSFALGVARNISSDLNGDSVVDGEASCMPVVQSRLGHKVGNLALGVSGHYGFMQNNQGNVEDDYNTWSLNIDAKVAVTPALTVQGEAYRGANTGAYFGAILNGDCVTDLESQGGWVSASYAVSPKVSVGVGAGVDDLRNETTTYVAHLADARTRNEMLFGNLIFTVVPGITTGVEISHWKTTYANVTAGNEISPTAVRLQWSLQTAF
jgi:hypothetical protein